MIYLRIGKRNAKAGKCGSKKREPITRGACWLTDDRLCVLTSNEIRFSCLSDLPIAAHKRGHFLNALQRERRRTKRFHCDAHELHGVVIRGHAIGAEGTAALAAVNDGPLSALAYPDGDWFHDAAAVTGPVAGFYVHMKARKAVWAMVAVVAACVFRHTRSTADPVSYTHLTLPTTSTV